MAHTLIYGGTFDPVHLGHLQTTGRAREILGADRVLLVPARVSPHKTDRQTASAEDRVAMLRLAIEGRAEFAIDTRELDRPPPSYMFDTVESLRADSPGERFTLLIGADQLARLHTWHRIEELLETTEFAVLPRRGGDWLKDVEAVAENLGEEISTRVIKGTLDTPLVNISSTEIRRRVRAGEAFEELVTPAVAAYIRTHHLYGAGR